MRGKAKLIRKEDGRYYVYAKDFWFQRWKPLTYSENSDEQISFKDFAEFGKITQIETFDVITLYYDKFSGMRG